VAARYFTPDEANEALPAIRPVVERLIRHRRALAEAEARRAALVEHIAGNGGDIQPSELAEATAALEDEAVGVARCIHEITELGALVKDLDSGLIDFPARRGDEEVLLCWQLGEEEVAHWHGTEEGFAGRKPLPWPV
jgi:hypothetical protein